MSGIASDIYAAQGPFLPYNSLILNMAGKPTKPYGSFIFPETDSGNDLGSVSCPVQK